MSKFNFWQRWLFVVCIAITFFGLLMFFLSGTSLFDVFNRQIDPAFWGSRSADAGIKAFQHWIYGIWGATIVGWGIVLTFITRFPFQNKEKWAWTCWVLGLSVWFVLDTGLSLFCKVYFNVAFNTILLILAGLPLFFTRKEFIESKKK